MSDAAEPPAAQKAKLPSRHSFRASYSQAKPVLAPSGTETAAQTQLWLAKDREHKPACSQADTTYQTLVRLAEAKESQCAVRKKLQSRHSFGSTSTASC